MNNIDNDWLERVKGRRPELFTGKKILELGSLDVNGSVREVWPEDVAWTGVDWKEGKNVDVVCVAQDTQFAPEEFDSIVSVNMLEHDPYWRESWAHNVPALKQGGIVFLGWAVRESAKHGPEFDPSHQDGYYPQSLADVKEHLVSLGLTILEANQEHNIYIGLMGRIIAQKA